MSNKHPQYELFRTAKIPVGHRIKDARRRVARELDLKGAPVEFTLIFAANRGTPEAQFLYDLALGRNGAVLKPTYEP